MKKYILRAKKLAFTSTAKDTYIIFSGNLLSAFLGFVYTVIAARILSISDFGVFSAGMNLIYIIIAISDIGLAGGVVQFVARLRSEGKNKQADEYIKAALILRVLSATFFCLFLLVFPLLIAEKLMATDQKAVTYWVFISTIGFVFYAFFPPVLQARKQFLKSTIVENSFMILRLTVALVAFFLGVANIYTFFLSFAVGDIGPLILGFAFVGFSFVYSKPKIGVFKSLILFSGWLGMSRVINSVAGRLDVQMLANLSGAVETGIYSIPSRLATFIIVLAGSFSTVLAPRLSAFNDKEKVKKYILKASFALTPIVLGVLLWILIAQPFISVLFGEKYIQSVPVFRILVLSTIPFLLTAPATSAIIFALKKPVYIGLYAIPQIVITYSLNRILIPTHGALGPAYALIIVNSLNLIYVWSVVIRHYWIKKS